MTSASARLGRMLAVLGIVLLAASGLTVAVGSSRVEAQVAGGGSGRYLGLIDWMTWGKPNDPIATGSKSVSRRTIGGRDLVTTCTLGSVPANQISAYRPGSYSGDAFDDMYNVGGTGNSNQLISGLKRSNGTSTFDVSCRTTYDGRPVPMAGLVFADAEASVNTEYVEGTGPGTWRIIDWSRTKGCTQSSTATLNGTTLRLTGPATLCASGPAAVGFLEAPAPADTITMTVGIKGGGTSAAALGVVLPTDFGDAPASYGEAGAVYSPPFSGGEVPAGGPTPVPGDRFDGNDELGVPAQPTPRLGATVDSDGAQRPSAAADADGADEDGLTSWSGPSSFAAGARYHLPGVACAGPGVVAGWVDWNSDGKFGDDERSGAVACAGTEVALDWTVPAGAVPPASDARSFLRLRTGPTDASIASPVGLSAGGEVEDYASPPLPADLKLTVAADPATVPPKATPVTWTLTVENRGPGNNSGFALTDTLPDAVTDLKTSTPGCAFTGSTLSCQGEPLAPGEPATVTFTGTVAGKAGDSVADAATVTGERDPDASDNHSSVTVAVKEPAEAAKPAPRPPASGPPASGPPAADPPASGPPASGPPASGRPASGPLAGGEVVTAPGGTAPGPAAAAAGAQGLRVSNGNSAAGAALPTTGSPSTWLALLGLALLVIGVGTGRLTRA